MAGVELNNNTAPNTKRTKILDVETCRIFAIHTKTRNYSRQNGETVAGVRLDNNTASTKQSERWIYMTSKPTKNEKTDPSNFRKYTRKWGVNHGDTVAGAALRQQHRSTKPEKKPSWNVCSNGHDTEEIHWYYAGLRGLSKNVGVTNCRGQLKLITSVKVGHSRTSSLFRVQYDTVRHSKDDIYWRHIL